MLEVIYEDNHLIAINKKSGDISQGDKTGDLPLSDYIKEYLKKKYNKLGNVYLGTIHRIDRPTSGVLVFAKTSKALSRMNELFREKNDCKGWRRPTHSSPPHSSLCLSLSPSRSG